LSSEEEEGVSYYKRSRKVEMKEGGNHHSFRLLSCTTWHGYDASSILGLNLDVSFFVVKKRGNRAEKKKQHKGGLENRGSCDGSVTKVAFREKTGNMNLGLRSTGPCRREEKGDWLSFVEESAREGQGGYKRQNRPSS